jgi:hypothetical protein
VGRTGSGFALNVTQPRGLGLAQRCSPAQPVSPRIRVRAPDGFCLAKLLAALSLNIREIILPVGVDISFRYGTIMPWLFSFHCSGLRSPSAYHSLLKKSEITREQKVFRSIITVSLEYTDYYNNYYRIISYVLSCLITYPVRSRMP